MHTIINRNHLLPISVIPSPIIAVSLITLLLSSLSFFLRSFFLGSLRRGWVYHSRRDIRPNMCRLKAGRNLHTGVITPIKVVSLKKVNLVRCNNLCFILPIMYNAGSKHIESCVTIQIVSNSH